MITLKSISLLIEIVTFKQHVFGRFIMQATLAALWSVVLDSYPAQIQPPPAVACYDLHQATPAQIQPPPAVACNDLHQATPAQSH